MLDSSRQVSSGSLTRPRAVARLLAATLAGAGCLGGAHSPASAQIDFENHYISTTFPRLSGFGQSTVGDFNNDGRPDFLMGILVPQLGQADQRAFHEARVR